MICLLLLLDSSGCPGEKGWKLRKSKMFLQPEVTPFWTPFSPGGFFTFLVAVAHGVSPLGSRYCPRFFDQVGHQTTKVSIENKHFFTK